MFLFSNYFLYKKYTKMKMYKNNINVYGASTVFIRLSSLGGIRPEICFIADSKVSAPGDQEPNESFESTRQ